MALTLNPRNPGKTTARGDRLDWSEIRDRIDLAAVATALLGPAPGRRGERSSRRLWWRCPFHDDRNPSFVATPGKPTWKCWGCGERGDAPNLVMRLKGWTFPETVRWLAELAGVVPSSASSRPWPSSIGPTQPRPPAADPVKAPGKPAPTPSGLPVADALALVDDAAKRIWTPEGADALGYLRRRGLADDTIKATRLGLTPGVSIPVRDGARFWTVEGITIPWLEGDRLVLVKIRRPERSKPKYAEAFRDRPGIFPCPDVIRPGKPLVIVEGEFDALLLGQALSELAAVVTLGSASNKPEGPGYLTMATAPVWYLAHDADPAGEKSAEGWPARAVRVRPPGPYKDWTEAAQAGVDLRHWWADRLGGIEVADPLDPAPWKVPPDGVVEPLVDSPLGTEAPAALPPWPPRPAELADWPIEWRERWGRSAKRLQDEGVPWPEHERQAFERTKAEMELHHNNPRRRQLAATSSIGRIGHIGLIPPGAVCTGNARFLSRSAL
jgi:hypothetical protein